MANTLIEQHAPASVCRAIAARDSSKILIHATVGVLQVLAQQAGGIIINVVVYDL